MPGIFWLEVPWHELVDPACWVALRNGLQFCLEVGVGFDAVQFAGLDQRGDAAPGAATLVMTREERIFPVQGNGPDYPLDHVAVHLDGPVLKEELQPLHVLGNVAELFTQSGLSGDPRTNGSETVFKVSHQRRGFFLSHRAAGLS